MFGNRGDKKRRQVQLTTAQLDRLSRIGLHARSVVEGTLAGLHKSNKKGSNVEFSGFREYTSGDDPRNLDWKVLGRTDKLFIKEFEEETNLRAYLVVDQSNSMNFGSDGMTKFQYAVSLASALAYLFVRQSDAVSIATFDNKIRDYLPPRSSPSQLQRIWRLLESLQPSQQSDFGVPLKELATRVRRRGLLCLVSDLMSDPVEILRALAHFRLKHFEVIVFHILDREELEFNLKGRIRFKDLETQAMVETSARGIRSTYLEQFGAFLERIRKDCFGNQIDYSLMRTDESLDLALHKYLIGRMSRLR